MRSLSPTFLAVLLTASLIFPHRVAAQPAQASEPTSKAPRFSEDIRPLLTSYCVSCHNTNKKKAGLDLEQFATDATALEKPAIWDQVGERVRAQEMPPGKSKQPNGDERQKLLAWAEHVAKAQVTRATLTREQLEQSTRSAQSRRLSR